MNARALRLTQNRWGFILFMSVMCSLSPFAMSFPVPAFPAIGLEFLKPVADIQLMISVFLVGLGVAQPIHGVLADRYGRRPVLLFGFAIFFLASAASFLTTSWTALVLCRFLQAVGVSAGTVTSRAIVNDLQPREEAAISLSYISIAMGLGPILAPVFGGVLDTTFGWRSIFAGCAFAGAVILFLAIWSLPETRPANKEPRNLLRDYNRLFRSPEFIGYTLIFGFGQGIFFAFLPFAPDYFENILNQNTGVFISAWIGLSLSFMAGSLLGTRLTGFLGMRRTLFVASLWLFIALAAMVGSLSLFGGGVLALIIPLMLAMLGTGLLCPLALAGSISFDPKLAATAAGTSSALGLVTGGLFSVISGVIYDGTLWPFMGLVAIAIFGNLAGVGLTRLTKEDL
ncbi:multidrug effflux MFS transporter [Litorimonas haliclonae]|uniref:multidrug effflux MFS transporter n=1 Tax=Litorimonas haliclonae TaxID=2081977 RepID=UPI0039EF6C57